MIQEIVIHTGKKDEIIDLTDKVRDFVGNAKVSEGLCVVYSRHATAGIVINENADSGFREDIIKALDEIIPGHNGWKHDLIDNNAASHLKASFIGPSEVIPIKDSKLMLGTWQGIALAEFDGPRERHIVIQIIKEK